MGKRELLVVLGFAIVGMVVYQLTAPPVSADARGFSVGGLIEQLRRHVRGNQANAETTSTTAYPVAESTNEVRLTLNCESLTIVGEDRQDVASELLVRSNGYDDAEASKLAGEVALKVVEGGGRLEFKISYPEGGRQRANVTLRVPARLRVSVGRYSGKLSVSNTGDLELSEARGDVTIRDVSGHVTATHRGGDLNIADVGALKLTARGSDSKIARVHGDVTIQSQAGDLGLTEPRGAIEVESNGTDLRLEKLESTTAPIRVTATNGSVRLAGVRSETRVDGRNAEVTIAMDRPAKVSVFMEGGDPVEFTPAPGGFDLDAATTGGGRITAPEKFVEVTRQGNEQHASGRIQGGGPTVTLRAADGEIVIRAPESVRATTPPAEKPERDTRTPDKPERK